MSSRDGAAAAPRAREDAVPVPHATAVVGGGAGARAPAPVLQMSAPAAGAAPAARPMALGGKEASAPDEAARLTAVHVALRPWVAAEPSDPPSAALSSQARGPPVLAVAVALSEMGDEARAAGRGARAHG